MYIEDLTERELAVINELFNNRINATKDMRYLMCVIEIMKTLQEEAKDNYESITQDSMYSIYIREMADSLYYHSNKEFNTIYDTAIEIVNCH